MPEQQDARAITFEKWWNVRDLGGLPTRDGGTTRHGVLLRAAGPGYASPADVDRARRLGLTTFVDLRRPGHDPDWRDAAAGVTVLDADLVSGLRPPREEITAENLLRFLLDGGREAIAEAIRTITTAARRSPPVVFHCHTGKDRTGLIAIVLLSLASVPEEEIIEDYLASNPGFEAMRRVLTSEMGAEFQAGAPAAVRGPVVRPAAENALRFLQDSGGAAAYLRSGGLGAEEIERAASLL
jgi:protein-tyrosine phosphatase